MRTPRRLKGHLFALAADAAGFRAKCCYCPALLSYREATVEHVVPRAFGGHPTRDAALACDACNQEKSRATNAAVNAARPRGKKPKKSPKSKKRSKR